MSSVVEDFLKKWYIRQPAMCQLS